MGFGVGGYYLIGIVTFIVSLAVSGWLRATYGRWSKVANASSLTGREVAEAIQLALEYDPSPPFSAGTPSAAGPERTAALKARVYDAAAARMAAALGSAQ